MTNFLHITRAELSKIFSVKINRTLMIVLVAAQIIVAVANAKSTLQVGLDATPETNPLLIEAIPPVELLVFDTLQFGIVFFIALAAMLGGADFSNHELRQGFLLTSKRKVFFNQRFLANSLVLILLAGLVISVSIIMTHLVIGAKEVTSFLLQPQIWKLISLSVLSWSLAGIFTFSLASLLKKAIVPLLLMNVFVMGLTGFSMDKWRWTAWLPMNAYVNIPYLLSDSTLKKGIISFLCMAIWIIVVAKISERQLSRMDIGGSY